MAVSKRQLGEAEIGIRIRIQDLGSPLGSGRGEPNSEKAMGTQTTAWDFKYGVSLDSGSLCVRDSV